MMNLLMSGLSNRQNQLNSLTNFGAQAMTNIQNMKLAKWSHQKDVEMWNRANEYNNPQNQMARLKAAGLNPNLVYGSGAVGNTSTQTPKYNMPSQEAPKIQLPDILNTLGMYHDVRQKEAQVDATKEVVRGKKIENTYLGQTLFNKMQKSGYEADILKLLHGLEVPAGGDYRESFKTSPFMQKYQATVRGQQLTNEIKRLEKNLMEKGIYRGDNILLRMLIQNGLFDSLLPSLRP